MPTDFDWKTWKRKQQEPEPPPPEPEDPKIIKFITWFADIMLYIVLAVSMVGVWLYTIDASNTIKLIDKCNEQKGVAVKTLRGDTVCIKEDVLTDVLNAKIPDRAK